jgi:Tfp pilus assembly protein FimT
MERGTSLLTLLVGMLCAGILSSITISGSRELLSSVHIRGSCQDIAQFLRGEKLLARRSGQPVAVRTLGPELESESGNSFLVDTALSPEFGLEQIVFYPRILASPTTLRFSNSRLRCTVTVSLRARVSAHIERL